MTNDVRVGVVGAGVMGAEHIRLLGEEIAGAVVTAVFEPDPDRAEMVRLRFPHITLRATADDVVHSGSVDAVVVAAPDELHEQIVMSCLDVGKPVLCEKPLATDAAGCLRIVDREVELGRRLVFVGLMRRFDPALRELWAALGRGVIGEPLVAHCRHRTRASMPWFTSEMMFTNAAVHDIDQVRWLLDAEVTGVMVHTPRAAVPSEGLADPQVVVFDTDGGTVVTLELFMNAGYGYEVSCEVVGSGGALSTAHIANSVLTQATLRSQAVDESFRERFAHAYGAELQGWVRAIRTGQEHAGATAWDGYVASTVADACVKAAHHGARIPLAARQRPALYAREKEPLIHAL